jgi:hypothetical protein
MNSLIMDIALNGTIGFHKMLRISWVAAQLAASQEELSSMSDSVEW